jgi:predicted small metal-binding protein
MFKFLCEHVVPGCSYDDRDESREKLEERAAIHLQEQHALNHHDEAIAEAMKTRGISFTS